jgi:hypothetical protein
MSSTRENSMGKQLKQNEGNEFEKIEGAEGAEKAEKAEKVEVPHVEREGVEREGVEREHGSVIAGPAASNDDGTINAGTGEKPEIENRESERPEAEGNEDRHGSHDDGLGDDHPGDAKVEFTTYIDIDGVPVLKSHIEVATVSRPKLDVAQFTFAEDGSILTMLEGDDDEDGLTFELERLDVNESLALLTILEKRYVLKQEVENGWVEFSLYRDDDADGVWTEVLEGHLNGTSDEVVELVGMTSLLPAADGVVG